MAKGNIIRLNFLHLNSVPLNGSKEVQRGSASGGGSIVPIPPSIPTFILTAGVANGVVTATLDGKAISLPYKAYKGDEIVLSVTPNDGYEFEGWSDGNKSNPRTIVVNEDITLNASCKEVFVPLPTYTLSASVSNGVVSATLNGSAISLPYEANEGDVIVVSVAPNEGFSFEGWADGNTDNPRSITMASDVVLSAECIAVPSESKHIQFADAEVERVLMSKGVSSDGVGITKEDAERVTSISTWFKDNTSITSFNELRYFTKVTQLDGNAFFGCTALQSVDTSNIATTKYGIFQGTTSLNQAMVFDKVVGTIGQSAFRYSALTALVAPNALACDTNMCESCPNIASADVRAMTTFGNYAFQRCPNLEEINISSAVTLGKQLFFECTSLKAIDVPSTTTSIGEACFMNCTSLQSVIVRATTPPSLGTRVFNGTTCPIYVPDASLEAYKTATNWNTYASRIKPLSEIEDYYISDALLMHLDGINKGNVEGEWQDLVSGKTFVNHGAIAEADGWRFDGASSYMSSTNMASYRPAYGDRTFEIVAEFDRENTTEVVYMGAGNGYAFGRYAGGKSILLGSNVGLPSLADDMTSGVRIVAVSTTAELQIVASKINGNNAQVGANNYFDGSINSIYLGKRASGTHFKGKIHAIRIHDRILSEEEILYNQRIDNKRFNLGLDI